MLTEGPPAAGGDFFTDCPITPAANLFKVMMRGLLALGEPALSPRDEISSPNPTFAPQVSNQYYLLDGVKR
jgi:hypothetical protein